MLFNLQSATLQRYRVPVNSYLLSKAIILYL